MTLPAALIRLQELESNGATWPWDMEMSEGDSDVLGTWSVNDNSRAFARFAITGAGSEIGFWFSQGLPLDQAPVVFLDSEGTENHVLARNFSEFLQLLAMGDPDPSLLGKVHDDRKDDLIRYRTWLRETLGLGVPKGKAVALVARAEAAAPGLQDWLEGIAPEDQEDQVPLADLVVAGKMEDLRTRLAAGVNYEDPLVKKAVKTAIFKDRANALELFLAHGMPLELKLDYGNTPLLEAVTCAKTALVKMMLAAGANPKARNDHRENADTLTSDLNANVRRAILKVLGFPV